MKIGKFCLIGSNVKIVLEKYTVYFDSAHPAFYLKDKPFKVYSNFNDFKEYDRIEIGNAVWIDENIITLAELLVKISTY